MAFRRCNAAILFFYKRSVCPVHSITRGGTHKIVKNILLHFLIFELGDPKIYMSIRQIQTFNNKKSLEVPRWCR
jgi:hypothetical protein